MERNRRFRDELGILSQAINQMAMRLARFVEGQKPFLGDVARELCSPPARLRMALGILDQRVAEDQLQYLTVAAEKAERIATLVDELLSFSMARRSVNVQLRPISLLEVVQMAIEREADAPAPA